MESHFNIEDADGTITRWRIVARGPTVHLRMAGETAEDWLVRMGSLLGQPDARAVQGASGSVVAVEVP